jgi:hypothetical protein
VKILLTGFDRIRYWMANTILGPASHSTRLRIPSLDLLGWTYSVTCHRIWKDNVHFRPRMTQACSIFSISLRLGWIHAPGLCKFYILTVTLTAKEDSDASVNSLQKFKFQRSGPCLGPQVGVFGPHPLVRFDLQIPCWTRKTLLHVQQRAPLLE